MRYQKIFLCILLFVALPIGAQQTLLQDQSMPDLSKLFSEKETSLTESIAYDQVIDPEYYIIGPTDVLSIQGLVSSQAMPFVVSPEAKLLLPLMGEVDVKGKTLAEVKRLIISKTGGKTSRGSSVSVTLQRPRKILVRIDGEVAKPGTYTVTAAHRSDFVLNLANKFTVEADGIEAVEQNYAQKKTARSVAEKSRPYSSSRDGERFSRRHIIVNHPDGTHSRIDLDRFYATREQAFNPVLREGDYIFIPNKRLTDAVIGIYGGVNQPGDYEFVEGDNLGLLVMMAFGVRDGANQVNAELTRASSDGTISTQAINLATSETLELQSGDRIFIPSKTVAKKVSGKVIVKGFVQKPGVYPITESTKLSEVIALAGGFLPSAYIPGGEVHRRDLDIDGNMLDYSTEMMKNARLSNLTYADTNFFKLEQIFDRGLVSVDFEKIFVANEKEADIPLKDGDVITVPENRNMVYVFGHVVNGGYQPYVAEKSAHYYISHAGGFSGIAEEGNTKVIKGKTREWMSPGETTVEPGDMIYVPREGDPGPGFALQKASIYVSVASTLVFLTSVLFSIFKK